MRLLETMKQTVTVKPAAAPETYQTDDRLYRFDEAGAFSIRAVVQPLSQRSALAVQGQTQAETLRMLYDGSETLFEGMGVCVDVNPNTACDYRISEMPRRYFSHKEFTLAFIPREQRR